MAAAFHIATLADPDADRTGAPGAPDDAQFIVALDGAALGPQWTRWRLAAVCRPWRAPGPPAHGPAVAIEAAGGPLWAEVVELAAWRDGCPLRLTQTAHQGQLRRSLHGIEAEGDPAVVAGFLRTAQRLLAAATAAVGGRPPAFASRDQFLRVVATVAAQLARRGQPVTATAVLRYLQLHTGHTFDPASWTRMHQRYGFARWRDVLRALPRASNR